MPHVISLVRREIPKILGSSTGFIVLIVVLVVLITVSLSAVIYLLRQERSGDQQAQRRRRYNAQPLLDRDLSNPQHSKKWYSYLWGSRDRHNHAQLDKSMERNEESWNVQANSRVDYSAEDSIMPCSDNQSGLLRNESSASFGVGPRFYTHPMQTPTSDDALSIRYDPHDVRGLPYPEQFPVSSQATIPSISESQLNSPILSSSSSPSRRIMKSSTISLDSVRDSLSQLAPPVPASGSKFFESL